MSERSGIELKSVDQTSVDETTTNKPEEENCLVFESKVETTIDVKPLETHQPIDLLIENPQEKNIFIKQGMQSKDSITHQPTDLLTEHIKEEDSLLKQATQAIDSTTHQHTDLPIESPQEEEEKDICTKEKTEAINSTTNAKEKNIVQDITATADEITTNIEDENTKTNSRHQNISTCDLQEQEVSRESSKDKYAEHVTYAEDGTAIYTDPKTNYQYKWCTKENNWIPKDATISNDPYENEHYKWCSVSQKWIPKQTQVTETEHYKWDADKKQWVAKVKETASTEQNAPTHIVYDIDEDGQRTYTDKDGMVFFWDVEKNAWFPKIDEDFMARYQMSYGFIDNTSESEKEKEKRDLDAAVEKEKELAQILEEAKANEEAAKSGFKRKQPQEPAKWFEIDPDHNTKVYVSNLPLDITLDEFADVMGKCGMIMRDPHTQKYKLKLYTESDGQIKGDGLCDYIKVESVDLALKILDEYDLRGHKMRVQRAQFQMRGEYNPALKPKRKKKDKEKLAKIKEKLFDWRPEKMRGERSKHEKTVVIKNLFHPDLFEKEVQLILDYQNDLREECGKCGTVRRVVIYDRHSEGVAQVNMSTPEEADLVIKMMNGRFFGKRKLTAEHWDGKTKYKIEETEEEIQKRLNKWDQYLDAAENKKPVKADEEEIQKDKE